MKYITDAMIINSHTLLRATLPMDTGNLRYNATTRTKLNNGFELSVGGHRAPYFEIIQTRTWSRHYNTFHDVNFTPVFRFLETALKGKFGGGRYLNKNGVKVYSAQMARQQFRLEFEDTAAREQVAARYGVE